MPANTLLLLRRSLFTILHFEGRDIELALTSVIVHVTDFSKDWPLFPALVVSAANAPHAAHETVRASAVNGIVIVQVDGDFQGLGGRRRPFQDLLGPIHPDRRGWRGGGEDVVA